MARKDLVQKTEGKKNVLEWKGEILAYPPKKLTEVELVEVAKKLTTRDTKRTKMINESKERAENANKAK